MTVIKTNLNNFLVAEDLMGFLTKNNQDLILTHKNVIKYANDVLCQTCGKNDFERIQQIRKFENSHDQNSKISV